MKLFPRSVMFLKTFTVLYLVCCTPVTLFAQTNTDWFKNAKFGILVHYLNSVQNSRTPWNQNKITSWDSCVNEFDVYTFADNVKSSGAGYVIFSIQSLDQFFCAPNRTFERLAGLKRGEGTSHRDLINDLYFALRAKGIPLMLYATGNGPFKDFATMERLTKNNYHNRVVNNAYQVTTAFVKTWASVLREFSLRYKSKIRGWWVDGVYAFTNYTDTTHKILVDALKSGNPKAIVALNPSPRDTISYFSKYDDYTAGETYHINSKPKRRFLKKVQWHALTFLGSDWGSNTIRFSESEVKSYLSSCNAKGGVVTFDVCLYRDGTLAPNQISFLKKLRY